MTVKSMYCSRRGSEFVPRTHMAAHNHLELQFQGIKRPLLTSCTLNTCGAHRHTYIHIKKINLLTTFVLFKDLFLRQDLAVLEIPM